MISIKRWKFFIPFTEHYFYDNAIKDDKIKTSFINFFIQSKIKISWVIKHTRTVVVDLQRTSEEIFVKLNKTYRYEINRAQKNDLIIIKWNINPKTEDIRLFCSVYNKFALAVNLKPANQKKLGLFSQAQSLVLSQAETSDGEKIVVHALIYDNKRMRLLYSASCFREVDKPMQALIGRANKNLHWYEILKAKEMGMVFYDFGGISIGGKTNNIDQFKCNFGGEVMDEYMCLKIGKM